MILFEIIFYIVLIVIPASIVLHLYNVFAQGRENDEQEKIAKEKINEDIRNLISEGYTSLDDVKPLILKHRFDDAELLYTHLRNKHTENLEQFYIDGVRRAFWILFREVVFTEVFNELWEEIESHAETLALKKKQLIYTDDYRQLITDDWDREKCHFVENILRPEEIFVRELYNYHAFWKGRYCDVAGGCSAAEKSAGYRCDIDNLSMLNEIDSIVDLQPEPATGHNNIEDISPLDFEKLCAENMRSYGLEATTTQASGDQGADVIATYGNYKIICQCKLYSSPVGNKAVQEVHAAKGYYGGSLAVVISITGYTKSAKQLAQSLGVKLIEFEELGYFSERVIAAVDKLG